MLKMKAKDRSLALVLSGLVFLLCAGCTANGARQTAAYERSIQRTKTALLAAGDADSLAAAALLSDGPKGNLGERLTLISRAVAAAPDRPDLIWLNMGVCIHIESCDPTPLATQLQAVDPANGAVWAVLIGRTGKNNYAAAARNNLAAISTSTRFDTYWNVMIVHANDAIRRTKTMDSRRALTATIGAAAAMTIPPYKSILNGCKGESINNPDVVATCRHVASVMRRGDTYITELAGVAIAKRAWPEGSTEYLDAASAERVAHYRMDAAAIIGLHHLGASESAAQLLQLMSEYQTEQEFNLAEIVNANWSPNPPSSWTDQSVAIGAVR